MFEVEVGRIPKGGAVAGDPVSKMNHMKQVTAEQAADALVSKSAAMKEEKESKKAAAETNLTTPAKGIKKGGGASSFLEIGTGMGTESTSVLSLAADDKAGQKVSEEDKMGGLFGSIIGGVLNPVMDVFGGVLG